MDELLYILKVDDTAPVQQWVANRLLLAQAPKYVRISSVVPLSNYGYPADAAGTILAINSRGFLVGVKDRPEIPRDFIPWSNVAYMADAADLVPA